ncbi:DUF1493 family protein [Cronobacter dublinensis]|uniref:DUF1493 family protein n=1 Tax=Cronobacter dublinensis TaxID=413497 RepID=UPI000CFF87F1|nr:DUF1493 family protein [Cronobacter dublinensis]ELY4000066.1 DUF1493 family protein [Cronobacter dublinensis]
MTGTDDVLAFFRKALPTLADLRFREIPLELDDALQDYAEPDDLLVAINQYDQHFHVDMSVMNWDRYFPWKQPWFFRKWFTRKPVVQTAKPLTVRMFAQSAKAGRWLFE